MDKDDPPHERRAIVPKARSRMSNPEIIPPEYIDTLRQIQEEQKRVQLEKAQDEADARLDRREKRAFNRTVALTLAVAIIANNPVAWVKGVYVWLMAHVISIR